MPLLAGRRLFSEASFGSFLLDASEETGSDVAIELIKKAAKIHDLTLNLEPGREADGLVVWRKGSATAVVEVKAKPRMCRRTS